MCQPDAAFAVDVACVPARMHRPGASEAALDAAEAQLGVSLPPAFRALYRVHDGQELKLDRDLDTTRTSLPHKSMFHGILGGCVRVGVGGLDREYGVHFPGGVDISCCREEACAQALAGELRTLRSDEFYKDLWVLQYS